MSRVLFLAAIFIATAARAAPESPAPPPPKIDLSAVGATLELRDELSSRVEPRTAIDYRLGRDALFGQFGYVCRSDLSPLADQESAGRRDAKDDRLLGGTLKYAF